MNKLAPTWWSSVPLLVGFLLMNALAAQSEPPSGPAQVVRFLHPPVLDGVPANWPSADSVEMTSQDGKARLRFGYDDNYFYALAEVEGTTPLKNSAVHPEEMIKGGGAVAFYFQTRPGDEQRVAITQLQGKPAVYVYRPVSEKKNPYTFASPVGETKFDYVAPLAEAKVAFRQEAKGYVVETALPWQSLGFSGPQKSFGFDAEVIFSDPAGTQNAGAVWLFAHDGPGLTIEDLPTEAKLYPDTWGHAALVTEFHAPETVTAPANSSNNANPAIDVDLPRKGKLSLNITDDKGWILRELVKAETVPAGKFTVKWDGRDRYNEPLPPGTYHWKAILFDGMQTAFLGSVGNSGRPPYRTPDGLGSMGGQHGVQKSVASDKGGVYMANALQEGPPAMRKIDPTTGKALWMRSAGSFGIIDQVAADEGMACLLNGTGKKGSRKIDLVRIDPKTGLDLPMATGSANVTLKLPTTGQATAGLAIVGGKAWFSVPDENRIGTVDLKSGVIGTDLPVPKPMGLARLDEKTLLVCSGTSVLAVDIVSGAHKPVIDGLIAPGAVCRDGDGNLYVSDLGTSQQIKKFSPDGKTLLATWGVAGGKPGTMVPYEPLAFANVTGMVVASDNNLWLAESSTPPRRYVKMTRDGKWLEDFCGPIAYNTFGPDLDDFSRIYYNIQSAGPSFVEAVVNYDQYQKDPIDTPNCWRIAAIYDLGVGADGKTPNDVMSQVAKAGYGHVIAFKATNGKRYLLRLSKNNRGSAPIGAGLWVEKAAHWVPCAFLSRDPAKIPSWTDQNGDGLIQPDEQYTDAAVKEVAWIDRDLTLQGFEGKLKPSSVNDLGAPRYDKGAFTPYLSPEQLAQIKGATTMVSTEADGTVYYLANVGPHRHLSFWDRATENRLVKVKDGKIQWIVGNHAAHPDATEFSTNSNIPGVIDGIVLAANIEPADYVAYTEDGFAIGDVTLDANGNHPKVGPTVINMESLNGLYLKDPRSGKNFLFSISSGDDRILQVTGPGKTDHFQGSVTVPSAEVLGTSPVIPYSSWYTNAGRGFGIDALDTEWQPTVPRLSISDGEKVVADVRLRRDKGALDVFASVTETTPLQSGEGIRLLLANRESGSTPVEIDLALTPDATAKSGQAVKVSLLRGGKEQDAMAIKAAAVERWQSLGYRLEADIPLTLLPEFSAGRKQTYRREVVEKNGMAPITETLPDLKSPLFLDVQVMSKGTHGEETSISFGKGKLEGVTLPAEDAK